ncbi:MAG TPA: hypothetical protein VNF68_09755 [Candidatus Baltobacteraceae bacterium]|nr:hypothetical protein [Candidatus Baltobacteraceae bacterium]
MRLLLVVAALVAMATSAARALPGQSAKAVCAWAKRSRDLRAVNCATGGSEGVNDYLFGYIRKPDVTIPGRLPNDNFLSFEAHPNGKGTIVTEIVRYHHLPDVPSMKFLRKGGEGLEIVRGLYGDAVANDFIKARFVKHAATGDVYRGRRFLYITTTIRQNNIGADAAHAVTIDDGFILRPAGSSPSDVGY